MLALVIGLVVAIIGVLLIVLPNIAWGKQVLTVIMGSLPLCLIGGGLLAVVAGITTIKDSIEAKKFEEERKKKEEEEKKAAEEKKE